MTQTHRFKVDKLIRDKLPAIMREAGIGVSERVMEKSEYIIRLKDKLLEEAEEVVESANQREICEELADLLEVMIAMARASGIEFTDIIETAEQKRLKKGGFDGRIYNAFIEIEAGHSSLGYYKACPEKYPEVK